MLPCPACLPATSLLPAQPLALPRLGELDFHTHTHTPSQCVREVCRLAKRLPAVCLPPYLLPALPLSSSSLSLCHSSNRWQLVDFLCGNSHAKTKPISPFICGRRQLPVGPVAAPFSTLSLSVSPPFFCVFVLCALFFFACFSFSFSHFHAELGCRRTNAPSKEINNRLLDYE